MVATLKVNKIENVSAAALAVEGLIIPKVQTGSIGNGGRMFIFTDSSSVSWIVHEFKMGGTFWAPDNGLTADVFMIGGGGSGGAATGNNDTGKGGGGAGGALFRQGFTIASGGHEIRIGRGGAGQTKGVAAATQKATMHNGGDTSAFDVIARGGGMGGASDNNNRAAEGGCGGGGGARNSNTSYNNGRGSTQGSYTGWTSYGGTGGNAAGSNTSGGGGGGIGGNGGNQSGSSNSSTSQAGSGGAGRDFSSYFGVTVGHFGFFGGGGGGGTYRHGTNDMYQAPPNNGSSNYGGGGFGASSREGSQTSPNVFATDKMDGIDGTGGGGGGAAEDHENVEPGGARSGCGGSGAIIIRYRLNP